MVPPSCNDIVPHICSPCRPRFFPLFSHASSVLCKLIVQSVKRAFQNHILSIHVTFHHPTPFSRIYQPNLHFQTPPFSLNIVPYPFGRPACCQVCRRRRRQTAKSGTFHVKRPASSAAPGFCSQIPQKRCRESLPAPTDFPLTLDFCAVYAIIK